MYRHEDAAKPEVCKFTVMVVAVTDDDVIVGAASGAATGAKIGSVFGPVGTGVGAVIGGIGGWFS